MVLVLSSVPERIIVCQYAFHLGLGRTIILGPTYFVVVSLSIGLSAIPYWSRSGNRFQQHRMSHEHNTEPVCTEIPVIMERWSEQSRFIARLWCRCCRSKAWMCHYAASWNYRMLWSNNLESTHALDPTIDFCYSSVLFNLNFSLQSGQILGMLPKKVTTSKSLTQIKSSSFSGTCMFSNYFVVVIQHKHCCLASMPSWARRKNKYCSENGPRPGWSSIRTPKIDAWSPYHVYKLLYIMIRH